MRGRRGWRDELARLPLPLPLERILERELTAVDRDEGLVVTGRNRSRPAGVGGGAAPAAVTAGNWCRRDRMDLRLRSRVSGGLRRRPGLGKKA